MKTFGQILVFFVWLIGITIFSGVFGFGGFLFFFFGTLVPIGIWLANRK